ncbi:tyrosine-type recombinase/integrase [Burkholderia sp. 22313]|uniref:tyrosine-type recombinase/integrase n=1 Tax=Burkholderia sp. 22313 TaxID=3453908 RepID=UPI003F826A44
MSPEVSPFHVALRSALASTGEAPKTIARRAGASTTALQRWMKGAFPNRRAFPSVRRIERELKLEAGALESLIPAVKKSLDDAALSTVSAQIDYRARLMRNIKDTYYIQPNALSTDFLAEWNAFFAYKTDKRTSLARTPRGTWRLFPGDKLAKLTAAHAWRNGLYCTTAQKTLDKFRSFFGFLVRPRENGGYGVSAGAAQSLAWFASRDAVNAYLEFLRGQAGGLVHGGHAAFAALAASLVNSETGFVAQQPKLIERLPPGTLNLNWANACRETLQLVKEWSNDATDVSRRPEEPIQALLDMSEPLAPLLRAVELLDQQAAFAAPGSRLEATRKRDALLLSIVIANPLRLRNLVTMTWRPNNTGSLYRREDGQWRIRFGPQDFKNDRKAIKGTYDAPLPRALAARIEEYLDEFRPRLLRANPKADWLFPNEDSGKWTSLNKHFFRLTRRLIPQTPGFGPHALRHLVATDYLRKHSNDFLTVSQLLHDKLETVLAEYAHLRQDDAFAKYEVHLRGVTAS